MFIDDVEKFNKMYNLPCNSTPTNLGLDKLKAMHSIIAEEVNEFHDIIENYDETNPIDTMGEGYWKPEPKIKEMFLEIIKDGLIKDKLTS
jgi:hypothetical protein